MPAAEAADSDARESAPLSDRELTRLFAPLARAGKIALAVSGGSDSLALLDAIDRWRRRGRRPEVVVLTVDHRLRKGSGREAAMVAKIARSRKLPARILVRAGAAPRSDVEAAARVARYRLLLAACREEGASHLVVAHHRDDVAETFLLRLKRGAGVFGLAAMRPAIAAGGITLVRPLLAVPRSRLRATALAAHWMPVDDPMNSDPRLARAAVRRLLARGTLDPALLAATAGKFAELADSIDASVTALIADAVTVDAFAVAWLDPERFAAAPEQVRARLLVRMLIAVGGDDYPPRYARLDALHGAIAASDSARPLKRTLGGVVIERKGARVAFYREAGRDGLPTMRVQPGFDGVWDHRFRVTVGTTAPLRLTLASVGEAGRREVRERLGPAAAGLPPAAVAVLPVVRQGRKIVAIPRVSPARRAVSVTFRQIVGARLRRPPLFPDPPLD